MKFRFVAPAADEVEEAISYSLTNFNLGDELTTAIKDAVGKITADPFRFAKRRDGFRVFNLSRFPYRLFFRPDEESETVIFYAVAHTSRRPGYWKPRISPP